jgi:hypothetical protein
MLREAKGGFSQNDGFPRMTMCSRESVYSPGETTFAFWESTIRVSDLDAIFPLNPG